MSIFYGMEVEVTLILIPYPANGPLINMKSGQLGMPQKCQSRVLDDIDYFRNSQNSNVTMMLTIMDVVMGK